jgi:hypothetical protein
LKPKKLASKDAGMRTPASPPPRDGLNRDYSESSRRGCPAPACGDTTRGVELGDNRNGEVSVLMHVVIQHRIKDPDRFFAGDPEEVATGGPSGVRGRQFFVSQDKSSAVCLWEADSVETLRDYMDGLTGDSAENTYFEVDTEISIGLPEAAQASA